MMSKDEVIKELEALLKASSGQSIRACYAGAEAALHYLKQEQVTLPEVPTPELLRCLFENGESKDIQHFASDSYAYRTTMKRYNALRAAVTAPRVRDVWIVYYEARNGANQWECESYRAASENDANKNMSIISRSDIMRNGVILKTTEPVEN